MQESWVSVSFMGPSTANQSLLQCYYHFRAAICDSGQPRNMQNERGEKNRLCGFILGNVQGQNLLCDLSAHRQKKKRCDVEKSGCDYLWLVILLCEITSDNKTHQRSRCRQAAP